MNLIYVIVIMMFFCSGMAMLVVLWHKWYVLNRQEVLYLIGFSIICLALAGYLTFLSLT